MDVHEESYANIVQRLNGLRKRIKKISLFKGTLGFLIIALLFIIFMLATEAVFYLSSNLRLILLSSALLLGSGTFTVLVLRPLYSIFFQPHSPDDITLALKVGNYFSHIRDRLADALQVFQKHKNNPEGYSLELADASLGRVTNEIKDIDFNSAVSTETVKKVSQWCIGALLAFGITFLIFPSSLFHASHRLLHPLQDFPKNSGLTFTVYPGNAEIVKGENVDIAVQVTGGEVPEIQLNLKKGAAKEFERRIIPANTEKQFFLLSRA
ncbi:MAG: hypothetical protein ACE5HI_16990 [bacterium]